LVVDAPIGATRCPHVAETFGFLDDATVREIPDVSPPLSSAPILAGRIERRRTPAAE